MIRLIRLGGVVVMVSSLVVLCASCWEHEPDEREPAESQFEFDGVFPDDHDWDWFRTVTLHFEVAPEQRPLEGVASAEVRHTVYDEPLIFQGYLTETRGWGRTLSLRLPQHENALTVTVETRDGLTRHTVTIAEDGTARTVFE